MTPAERALPANRLLAALPHKDRERLLDGAERVELVFADVLCEPGERMHHVYFPIESFISLVARVDDSSFLEVGLVGDEGMLGIPVSLGVNTAALRAVVQGAGSALRINAAPFRREVERSAPLKRQLNRYQYVSRSQLARAGACTRFHMVEARLARWLLMTGDRSHSNDFTITHEFLAYMLGVRRAGVTTAAGMLQHRKLISYRRGCVRILDRAGLKRASCGCYAADRATYARVMRTGS